MDFDFLLLRPLELEWFESTALGVETFDDLDPYSATYNSLRLNNAFVSATPAHPFVDYLLHKIEANYDPEAWAAIGPDLITHSYVAQPEAVQLSVQLIFPHVLYPLHWARAHAILDINRQMIDGDWPPHKRDQSIGVHLYNSNSFRHVCFEETCSYYRLVEPPPGSLLSEILDKVRLPQCDDLRIPALEARTRGQYYIDRVLNMRNIAQSNVTNATERLMAAHEWEVTQKAGGDEGLIKRAAQDKAYRVHFLELTTRRLAVVMEFLPLAYEYAALVAAKIANYSAYLDRSVQR